MFVEVPVLESTPDAVSMTITTSTSNLPIDGCDATEISRNDLPSDNEQCASTAPAGKRKNRNPKNEGSLNRVIRGSRGVINPSVLEDEDSENLNNSATAFDVESDLNSVQENLSDEEATKLAEQIREHWNEHQKKKVSVAKSRGRLNLLRSRLASELFSYKKHLVRVGRNGGWAPFLRERDIPLSTADRYVKQCELSLMRSSGKLLTEEIQVPTTDDVTRLVTRLEPKLRSVLTTADSVTQFMAELGTVLNRWETSE